MDLNSHEFQINSASNDLLIYDTSSNISLPRSWVHISTGFELKSDGSCDISFGLYGNYVLIQSHKVRCDISNNTTLYNIDYAYNLEDSSSNRYTIRATTNPSSALLGYTGDYYNKFILNHYPYA